MSKYCIYLAHVPRPIYGTDERSTDEMVAALAPEHTVDGLPADWTWLAGLDVRKSSVVGIRLVHASDPQEE